jgi:hypothetical protein
MIAAGSVSSVGVSELFGNHLSGSQGLNYLGERPFATAPFRLCCSA